jgi:single-stranded-DNA-specific exonuclease RecJ
LVSTSLVLTPKTWILRNEWMPATVLTDSTLLEAARGSEILLKLLWNRGYQTSQAIRAFLDPELVFTTECLGRALPDAVLALDRLDQALDQQETILVYGDFDVDGVTGTSIWMECLTVLGAKVSFYIPDRDTEGHGLHAASLCRLVSSRKPKLVVTTDTGISNYNEISLLKGLGVETIVTDHHEVPELLPPSVANVNCQRLSDRQHPLAHLSGAGVAFLLAEELLKRRLPPEEAKHHAKALLDLVAVGLIADMVPLLGENRRLVQRGLEVLATRQRLGVQVLLETAGTAPEAPVSAETVGFTIGPRINALGRLERADDAVTLLTTHDRAEAQRIAQRLEQLNRKRQELCDKTFLEAEQFLSQTGGLGDRKALILGSPAWHPGIIGIVASRLIEKYRVPTCLLVVNESAGTARSSARSIQGFHITEALDAQKAYLTHYGGHAGAAGFALPLEKLNAFKQAFYAYAAEHVTEAMTLPRVEVDLALSLKQVTLGLVELQSQLAPFGMSNPEPVYALKSVYVAANRPLGESGKHRKLMLATKPNALEGALDCLWWNADSERTFSPEQPYDVLVTVGENTWNGKTTVRLTLKDIRQNGVSESTPQRADARDKMVALASQQEVLNKPVENTVLKAPLNQQVLPVLRTCFDARDKESQQAFLNTLMTSAGKQPRRLRVFHEGKAPDIPFLPPECLMTRLTVAFCEELVFWDYPPTPALLFQVVQTAQPKVIHWVGGKYPTIPLSYSVEWFLKGLWQVCKLLVDSPEGFTVDALATRLAARADAVRVGFKLLEMAELLTLETAALETETLVWRLRKPEAPLPALINLDGLLLQVLTPLITEQGQWREWLHGVSFATHLQLMLQAIRPDQLQVSWLAESLTLLPSLGIHPEEQGSSAPASPIVLNTAV